MNVPHSEHTGCGQADQMLVFLIAANVNNGKQVTHQFPCQHKCLDEPLYYPPISNTRKLYWKICKLVNCVPVRQFIVICETLFICRTESTCVTRGSFAIPCDIV